MKIEAVRIFVDNQPDRMIIREAVWGGKTIADFGPVSECDLATVYAMAAAPKMLEALEYAAKLIKVARNHFPKSVINSDRFQLENACATIGKAITEARGEA